MTDTIGAIVAIVSITEGEGRARTLAAEEVRLAADALVLVDGAKARLAEAQSGLAAHVDVLRRLGVTIDDALDVLGRPPGLGDAIRDRLTAMLEVEP